MKTTSLILLAAVVLPSSLATAAEPDVLDPRGVPGKELISRTILASDLDGDGADEEIVLINRITGSKELARTFDVQLGVYGASGRLLWAHSVLETSGGPCYGGELTLVDLEGDGLNEMVLSYLSSDGPDLWKSHGAVARWEGGRGRLVWEGIERLDNSRHDGTPSAERTVFRMELDLGRTLGAKGRTLFFEKRVTMAAGVGLETPRIITERFALPPRMDR